MPLADAETLGEVRSVSKFDGREFHGTRGTRDDGFRRVNGFSTKIHADRQGKHIVGCKTYIPGKSVLRMSAVEAQALVEEFAGSGVWKSQNKEVVDFHRVIGTWVNDANGERSETTRGIIHYSKAGCHIVPTRPERRQ